MKLTSIILRKMDRNERVTNEFAIKLQERINRFREEFNSDLIFPGSVDDADTSQQSITSENSHEIYNILDYRLKNQLKLLKQQCSSTPVQKPQLTFYQNLLTITADVIDLNIAKDLIANEVNAIQESVASNAPHRDSQDPDH